MRVVFGTRREQPTAAPDANLLTVHVRRHPRHLVYYDRPITVICHWSRGIYVILICYLSIYLNSDTAFACQQISTLDAL